LFGENRNMSALLKFVIDKSIPLPGVRIRTVGKYPFGDMEVGDSFEFDESRQKSVRAASSSFAKYHGKQFTVSCRKGTGKGRCWRVK
jgi:hypothetical protein